MKLCSRTSMPESGFFHHSEVPLVLSLFPVGQFANTYSSEVGFILCCLFPGMNKMVINHLDKIFVTKDAVSDLEVTAHCPFAKILVLAGKLNKRKSGMAQISLFPSLGSSSRMLKSLSGPPCIPMRSLVDMLKQSPRVGLRNGVHACILFIRVHPSGILIIFLTKL